MTRRSIISKCIHVHSIYKCTFVLLLLIMLYVYCGLRNNIVNNIEDQTDNHVLHTCYNSNYNVEYVDFLEDVLTSKVQPKGGKSIFFHETACRKGIISINARQACAVESAARANPNVDIFLMFASPAGFLKNEFKPGIIEALLSYDNVHMRNLNLWTYLKDTPLNAFLHTNKIFQSKFVTSHLSDLLRYVSLYKWGGTYLDLDMIIKQNLDSYENYAVAVNDHEVGSSMMNFDDGPIGKNIAQKCLRNFEKNFDGRQWATNGPGVIKRVMQKLCKTNSTDMMTREHCHGFLVLNPVIAYAFPSFKWKYFFDEKYTEQVVNITKDSIAVHVFNKMSASTSIRVGSHTAYELLAKDNCPRVYASSGDYM